MLPTLKDTIAAISTPHGQGAISVIRLSGTKSPEILEKIFKPNKNISKIKYHTLYHGKILKNNEIVDDVLISCMPERRSYTGESMVEIFGHGGNAAPQEVLSAALNAGARLAQPGEFTYRALRHGKMDLTQAEAVFDVIHAKNKSALILAQKNLEGAFSKEIKEIRAAVLEVLVHTEAAIDFSTEDIDVFPKEKINEKIISVKIKMEAILGTYKSGRIFLEGAQVAIIGKPNVGKSSLLNALLSRDRAIVTAEPGTTRDTLEEVFTYQGPTGGSLTMTLIDTAGIREASNEIEKMGIEKTKQKIKNADIILSLFDVSSPLTDEDLAILDLSALKKRILVLNKIDLGVNKETKTALLKNENCVEISAAQKQGIETLLQKTYEYVLGEELNSETVYLTKERHRVGLEKALFYLAQFQAGLAQDRSFEFLALDLKDAVGSLEDIIGSVGLEDVYDQIFSTFCIGK